MILKSLSALLIVFMLISNAAFAKEVSDIEDMLNKAVNLGTITSSKTFNVCMQNEDSEYLVKFRVETDGEYLLSTSSADANFEGRLLSRNFNYELVVDCTDFNINGKKKRLFNCKEDLSSSKTYYIYFNATGSPYTPGCVEFSIKKIK